MKIRKATAADLKDLKSLNNKYIKEKKDWKKELTNKNNICFVCEKDEDIIGYFLIEFQQWNNSVWIRHIAIDSKQRRKGYATGCIQKIKEIAKSKKARVILLETQPTNEAVKCYRKNGFRKCGYNDRYYSNKKNGIALFMSYDLR